MRCDRPAHCARVCVLAAPPSLSLTVSFCLSVRVSLFLPQRRRACAARVHRAGAVRHLAGAVRSASPLLSRCCRPCESSWGSACARSSRYRFWQHIKADRDDATSWPGEYVHPGGVEVDWGIPGVELSDHPPMIGICEQLMGVGKFKKGLRPPNPKFGETEENKETDCMTVNWPTQEPWRRPAGGHIEGGNGKKDGWKGAFMMGAKRERLRNGSHARTLRPRGSRVTMFHVV